jgi:hypothetical protein
VTLRCTNVQNSGGSTIADLFARADTSGTLVALDLMRHVASSAEALLALEASERRVSEAVGPVTQRRGERTQSSLDQVFGRAALEFSYADYVARLSATRMSQERVVVREQYQWAPEGKLALKD